jgi:hypothetical protein
VKLSESISTENLPSSQSIAKARNALFSMFCILLAYWTYVSLISSANGYPYSAWPPIANIGTVGLDCYLIFQIFKLGAANRLLKVFVFFVTFQAVSALISKYILNYQFCFNFDAGRGWNYSICAPGAIFSSLIRLTGFGGEPSIFASYLCIVIIVAWWPQFKFRIPSAIFISGACAWAALISNSTTGTTLVFLSFALILFQRFRINHGPILLVLYGSTVYYFVNTNIIQVAIEKVFAEKKKSNLGSITDRSLNLSFSDYLTRWESHPFGDLWGFRGTSYSKSINLLAESMMYGPAVILFMLFLIFVSVLFSISRVRSLSVTLLIFITCLFLQPTWLNAIWIVLIYLLTVVNLDEDSDVVNSRVRKQE